MLDLRVPSGCFFALLGVILLAYGVAVPDARAALTESNVNLYCGLGMLLFGAIMLLLAFRASRQGS
jgi:hypothetical protein